jgi:hypothetical protein
VRHQACLYAVLVVVSCSWLAACGSGGQYGYTRTYEPLLAEQGHFQQAQELPYEQVKTAPYDFKETEVAWFGVVESMSELPDDQTQLKLAVRVHQARHLCRDEYEDSCRITVSQTSTGSFVVRLKLGAKEKSGQERVWLGSLLKIYGRPTGDFDDKGDPVLEVTYYRHWPRGYYVTTAQRSAMKR